MARRETSARRGSPMTSRPLPDTPTASSPTGPYSEIEEPTDLELLYRNAIANMQAGRYPLAANQLLQVLEVQPDHQLAKHKLKRVLIAWEERLNETYRSDLHQNERTRPRHSLPDDQIKRVADHLQRLLPKELGSSNVMSRHVECVFDPIIAWWSLVDPDSDLLLSGSLGERMFLPELFEAESSQHLTSADIDVLKWFKHDNCVVDVKAGAHPNSQLFMDQRGCDRGYTRIKRVGPSQPSYVEYKPVGNPTAEPNLQSPAITSDSFYQYHADEVFCYKCREWPAIAGTAFKQNSSWPTGSLLRELRQTEILLVHKPDSSNNSNIASCWRLSFSLPEQLLSWSISDDSRYVYLVSKMLLKYHLHKLAAFKSYYLKTAFYWFLSGRGDQLCGSASDVVAVLQSVQKVFEKGVLDHFFIADINLLNEHSRADMEAVTQRIGRLLWDIEWTIIKTLVSVTPIDYRSEDEALQAISEFRTGMVETLAAGEASRESLMEAQLSLLPGTTGAPCSHIPIVLVSRIHYAILCKRLDEAQEYHDHLVPAKEKRFLKRFGVTKFEQSQSTLFTGVLADAIQLNGPYYMKLRDYSTYIQMWYEYDLNKEVKKESGNCNDEAVVKSRKAFIHELVLFLYHLHSTEFTGEFLQHYWCLTAQYSNMFDFNHDSEYKNRTDIVFQLLEAVRHPGPQSQPARWIADAINNVTEPNRDDAEFNRFMNLDAHQLHTLRQFVSNPKTNSRWKSFTDCLRHLA